MIATGRVYSASTGYDAGAARYHGGGGAQDPSIGAAGLARTTLAGEEQGHGAAVQADCSILVAAHVFTGSNGDAAVVRWTPGGVLDPAFGAGGVSAPAGIPGNDFAMGDNLFLGTTVAVDPDSDGDGLTDSAEAALGTNANDSDTDDDGLSDGAEVAAAAGGACPNPLNPDSDGDGRGDGRGDGDEALVLLTSPCDPDMDDDGLLDGGEFDFGTDPWDPDSDDDGIQDGPEASLSIGGCPSLLDPDSDEDGVNDGQEVLVLGTNPCSNDSDADGLTDGSEAGYGTLPLDPDTDHDGVLEGTEVGTMTGGCPDPQDPDSDDDGLADGHEVHVAGTDPRRVDTDGDGVGDATDPLPTSPRVTSSWLQDALLAEALFIESIDLGLFIAPNANAAQGRRNSLASRCRAAAAALAASSPADALDAMTSLLQ